MRIVSVLDKLLDESIFSSNPVRKAKAVGHVRRLMREPLRAKEASEKLKKHVDDQKLHSDISHFAEKDPHVDVRPVVKQRLKQLKVQGF